MLHSQNILELDALHSQFTLAPNIYVDTYGVHTWMLVACLLGIMIYLQEEH